MNTERKKKRVYIEFVSGKYLLLTYLNRPRMHDTLRQFFNDFVLIALWFFYFMLLCVAISLSVCIPAAVGVFLHFFDRLCQFIFFIFIIFCRNYRKKQLREKKQ